MFKKAITLYVLVLLILRFGVSFDETDFISKYQASLETSSASTTQEIEHLVHSLYELDKENVSLVYITGVFQYLSSRINDSIQSFRILCDLDEYKTPRYVIQYATVLNTSDPDGAIEVLESGMQSNPKNIALRAALVDAYLYTNRLHDAFRSLIILIGLQPEDYRLWTRFTSFFLSNHGIFHSTLLNKGSAAVEFDIVYIRKLFIIGLQLYPRCAGLLFAEALTYALAAHFENNPQHFSCAFDLLQRSIKYGIEHWVYIDSDGSDKSYRSLAEYNLEMIRNAVKRESLEHVVDLTAAVDCIDPISKHQYIFSPDSKIDTVPEIVNNSHGQWLQIGCSSTELCAKIGWTSVDALEGLSVHIVAPAYGLEMLPDASFERLYSSHTLEHLSHSQETAIRNGTIVSSELGVTMMEWHRILIPGGDIFISVPDSDLLFRLLASKSLLRHEKNLVLSILYGGQDYKYNFHKMGFYFDGLRLMLENYGFCDIERVTDFGFFIDASTLALNLKQGKQEMVSVNIHAKRCMK